MNEETAMIVQHTILPGQPEIPIEQAAQAADAARDHHLLKNYQEERSAETLERQGYDLALFAKYLESVYVRHGDFYHDLEAWRHINAALVDGFKQWMKREGYAIGSINVRLATVKAYCKIAHDAGIIPTATYIRIQGVQGIPHKSAVHVDRKRAVTRREHAGCATTKKAQATDIPDEALPLLKHPQTGPLAARDGLLMCILLDHGLRVGEVAILKKTQIDLEARLLTFDRPKVTKEREKHRLSDDTLAAARLYLPIIPPEQESLFDLAVTSIQERVRLIGHLAGIEGLSPHDCRHSAADRATRNGASLDALMQFGGWTNYGTPLQYLKRRAISNEGINL